MDYSMTITPAVSPAVRAKFEDKLDGFLEEFDGETTGGGTMLDGSESDLDFCCEKRGFEDGLKEFIRQHAPFSATFKLRNLDENKEVFVIEHTAAKPWWKFW